MGLLEAPIVLDVHAQFLLLSEFVRGSSKSSSSAGARSSIIVILSGLEIIPHVGIHGEQWCLQLSVGVLLLGLVDGVTNVCMKVISQIVFRDGIGHFDRALLEF